MIADTWAWLTDPAHWDGADGIWWRTVEHLQYTAISTIIALAVAIPIGAAIGHTGKGSGLVAGLANALRALPSRRTRRPRTSSATSARTTSKP